MDIAHAPVIRPAQQSKKLTHDTPVVVLHRGGPPVRDKFDSEDWEIPGPGYFTLRYDAASHLKARAVVPGSRNPATGRQESQLAIVQTAWGDPIDPPARCTPFTPEQVAHYWKSAEAIDRSSMASPAARNVQAVDMADAQRALLSAGMNIDGIVESEAAQGHVIATPVPPEANEALQEIRATLADAQAEGHVATGEAPPRRRMR